MILKHKKVTEKIIRAFYNVYNELGRGFLESVYQKSMAIELEELGISNDLEQPIKIYYKKKEVGDFRADIVVENTVIIELKAVRTILPEHEAQLINYLKATKIEVGLLLNFGEKAEIKRFAYNNSRKTNIPKIIKNK